MTLLGNRPDSAQAQGDQARGGVLARSLRADAEAVRLARATAVVWFIALLVLIANHPGQVFFDTKLGVDIDPAGFLARLWHLWNPLESFGTLQNQYIGYAFPMAPFYLAGHVVGVPAWLTERLWLALLIAVGFAGLVKLAAALRIGSPGSRLVAGITFALWPTFTILIGSTSAGLLPGLLAPWAVLPLVSVARGSASLPRAAARSGVAVLCMGGVNATSTLAALILPALYIVAGLPELSLRRRAALAAWWAGAVGLATAWWAGPLLLQARYSFNFLPYIEQSATTSATMSAATFLRGAGNWTAYLNLGQPWLQAGWIMVATPLAIVAGAIAAGAGLAGLSRRDIPVGGWLRLTFGFCALIALAGYPGPLGGPFHSQVGQLLDGALAPVRSVYKFEPTAAAVLALGIAHVLSLRQPAATDRPLLLLRRFLLAPMAGLVLLGLGYPYLSGQVLNAGSFTSLPGYWYRAAAFLRTHSPRAPALIVPASAHGTYLWGEPVDEPLEPLASSPWVTESLVPYGGTGSQLLLDSVESAIASGEDVPGLAATLSRAGIGYVVVRNDLNPFSVGYTPPWVVHAALVQSGFRRVAAFGPLVTGAQTDPGAPQIDASLPSYPAVEIFQSTAAAGQPPGVAVALPVSRTVLVNGGPDGLLQLAGQGILGNAPAILAGDRLIASPARWAITDSLRRADHYFGLIDPSASATYTATEVNPPDDPLGGAGAAPRQMLPVAGTAHQTVAVLAGATAVTASSTGSWAGETPQIDPVNAFDGNPGTYWSEASPVSPVGQWIQITFRHPVVLSDAIGIRLLNDSSLRAVPDRLTVLTSAGVRTSTVRRTGRVQPLPVPPGPTTMLRITIAGARGGIPGGPGAGFTEILIPGVRVTKYLRPPQSGAGLAAGQVAYSFQNQVPSPASLANVAAYPPMARTFITARIASYHLAALATPIPGRALDQILSQLTPKRADTVEVTASSTFGSLPALEPAALLNRPGPGLWLAGGPNSYIRLSWQGKRTIRRLILQSVPGLSATPTSIKLASPDGVRYADVGFGGLTEIVPPLTTSQMTISFPVVQDSTTSQAVSGQAVHLPVGLSRLTVPALAGLRASAPVPGRSFSLPCGLGPVLRVDGRVFQTSVSGVIGDLTDFRPVRVRLCSARSALTLSPGRHWLAAARPRAFAVADLSLTSPSPAAAGAAAAAVPGRAVHVLTWQSEYRQLRVGPGAAAYLEVHQNANAGWTATLRGRRLVPVRLDGWQQGFVLPAGAGGVVKLTFQPVGLYHAWIALSVLGVLALLVVAAGRRRRMVAGQMELRPVPQAGSAAGSAAGRVRVSVWSVPVATSAGVLGLVALLVLVGGPVALIVPVLAFAAYRAPGWYGGIALAAALVAGAISAAAAHPTAGTGAFGAPAQAFALVALAAAVMPVLPGRRHRQGGLHVRPTAQGGPGAPVAPGQFARAPFGVADELTCYYDRPAEPASVHLEVRLPGRADPDAVRSAVAAVLEAEPGLRVRRAAASRWQRRFEWEFAAGCDADPVLTTTWTDETDLARQRADFLSWSPPLDRSPPFRFLLACGTDADYLLLNAHHARFDGLSCLRLVRQVAGLVPVGTGARQDPWPQSPPVRGRRHARAGRVAGRTARDASRSASRLLSHAGAITRVAGLPDDEGQGGGYGACLLDWDGLPVAADPLARAGASVNDLLIAALMIAVSDWNESLGAGQGRLRITMPVGDRSDTGGWGNVSRLTSVTAHVPPGTAVSDLIGSVAQQTKAAKERPGPQVGLAGRVLAAAPLPVAAKSSVLAAGLRFAGPWLCDTSLVTNLGKSEPIQFGTTEATDAWFSTSAHMPRGLSLGAITIGSRLRLAFRYRHALLSDSAAASFARHYRDVLDGFAASQEVPW